MLLHGKPLDRHGSDWADALAIWADTSQDIRPKSILAAWRFPLVTVPNSKIVTRGSTFPKSAQLLGSLT